MKGHNKPKGKIGRLPFDVRQELNARMRDGETDAAILAWLNALPAVRAIMSEASFGGRRKARAEITAANLSQYRSGGYQLWLADQNRVEQVKTLSELSYRMAEAAGGNVSKSAVTLASTKFLEAMEAATKDDVVVLAKALTNLSKAESADMRAETDRRRLDVQREALALETQRFRRQTAELFLQWYGDKRAQEIAEGRATKDVKIDKLRELMFGAAADA